jgi:NADH:ubiquinone oxidoreductase subunit
MATIGTKLYSFWHGRIVGQDKFGNKYYEAKKELSVTGKKKRWVIYKGIPEASKVPANWHGWLHYTSDELPDANSAVQFDWIKEHLPNLTGTKNAYRPAGDINSGKEKIKTVGDYQAWKPN